MSFVTRVRRWWGWPARSTSTARRAVRERLWALLLEGVTEIVIDARGLTSMDRVGLDVLDAVSGLVVERRGRFVVCSPSEKIVDFVLRARIPAMTMIA